MNFNTLIIVLFIILITGVIYNTIILSKIKNRKVVDAKGLGDSRYFELKFRLQLFASIGTLVLIFVGFIGIETKEKLEDSFSNRFNILSQEVSDLDSLILQKQSLVEEINSKSDEIRITQQTVEQNIQGVERKMNKINDDLIYAAELYSNAQIYSRVKFKISRKQLSNYFDTSIAWSNRKKVSSPIKISFEECLNIDTKERVSDFKMPPSIVVVKINNSEIYLNIKRVTDKYFTLECLIRDKMSYVEKYGQNNNRLENDIRSALFYDEYSDFKENLESTLQLGFKSFEDNYYISYSFPKDLEVEAILIRSSRSY